MLTGAAKRIDQLQLDNDALTDLVYNLETNVKTLEEAARSRQAQTIQNVRVIYAGNERPATRQQLEKEVQRLAETLRGLKLSEVSPEIVAQIFDGRIVTTDEGRFVLQLRWLILGQETSVSVTADPLRSL